MEGEFIMNRIDIIKHYIVNELIEDTLYITT